MQGQLESLQRELDNAKHEFDLSTKVSLIKNKSFGFKPNLIYYDIVYLSTCIYSSGGGGGSEWHGHVPICFKVNNNCSKVEHDHQ